MFTTLKRLQEENACSPRFDFLLRKLGKKQEDDEHLPIRTILETNGILDALWALRTVDYNEEFEAKLLALYKEIMGDHKFELETNIPHLMPYEAALYLWSDVSSRGESIRGEFIRQKEILLKYI